MLLRISRLPAVLQAYLARQILLFALIPGGVHEMRSATIVAPRKHVAAFARGTATSRREVFRLRLRQITANIKAGKHLFVTARMAPFGAWGRLFLSQKTNMVSHTVIH